MNWIKEQGWYFLLFAIAGEIIIPIVLTPFYKGYSHMTMALSSFGSTNSPVKSVYNFWMLSAGILFLLSIPALFETFHKSSFAISLICAVCIAFFAVGACVFTCFFSVNEIKDITTTASKIHGAGSAAGFMFMLLVPLFLANLSYRVDDKLTGVVSAVSFVLACIFFALFIMADKSQFHNTFIAKEGVWQRLNLLFMYLPLGFLAINRINSR